MEPLLATQTNKAKESDRARSGMRLDESPRTEDTAPQASGTNEFKARPHALRERQAIFQAVHPREKEKPAVAIGVRRRLVSTKLVLEWRAIVAWTVVAIPVTIAVAAAITVPPVITLPTMAIIIVPVA
jgi:hypothetical protein